MGKLEKHNYFDISLIAQLCWLFGMFGVMFWLGEWVAVVNAPDVYGWGFVASLIIAMMLVFVGSVTNCYLGWVSRNEGVEINE